jgi:tight adherence protein C
VTIVLAVVWAMLVAQAGWTHRPLRRRGVTPLVERQTPPVVRRRRARKRDAAAVVAELPDVVDLFALAVGAGRTGTRALAAVASRAPPAWRPALEHATGRVSSGDRLGDALAGLTTALGEAARPLATALAASARYGTPLLPALERLAIDARSERRRRAEEAARRLPITLLFPLVLCVLPAFGLLTLAPSLAGALRTLRL